MILGADAMIPSTFPGMKDVLRVGRNRITETLTITFLACLALLLGGCSREVDKPISPPAPSSARAAAFELNRRLGRGVNLGNALEAPREGEWGVVLKEAYFQLIMDVGFDAVRVPIRWSAHADPLEPYTIETSFFERVDWAVEQALSRGLLVVINVHHYEELMQDPAPHAERLLALWEQIAEHYRDYPPELLFEILNEPSGKLDTVEWNRLLEEAIGAIRVTNPDRTIIVGPAFWNSVYSLRLLKLPQEDDHLIVTVHYYNPFQFTHQGAEWVDGSQPWLGTTWQGTSTQESAVIGDLDLAASWGKENDRPIYLGEFGAYSKADMDSRALWTQFVARQAEERGISWAYWEFGAGFGVYDRFRKVWNRPLLDALIPREQ
jgi:endoglucanase